MCDRIGGHSMSRGRFFEAVPADSTHRPRRDRVIRIGRAELATFTTLFVVYLATLAPSVTLWDSGEFLSAIHSLGIPHPPGTPVYVLVANVWTKLFGPLIGFAHSVNVLSALCTAIACALLANLFSRWTGDRLAAAIAGICAGAMSSVWMSATETEVYSSALLVGILILFIANSFAETGQRRWLFFAAYVAGLGYALHLTALLTVPAAIYLAFSTGKFRESVRRAPALVLLFVLGASAVLFMLVRAHHDPAVNQGNPSSFAALSDVLTRKQYAPAAPWPRQAPWFIQLGNIFEYSDWQIALGLAPDPPPSWVRTPFTVLFGVLGMIGFVAHRRAHRRSWIALLILFITTTLGVLVYLNLKAGPSYGGGFIAANARHEARERDYFFALGFACWGLWAGFGAVRVLRSTRITPALGVIAAIIPIALNWRAVDRRSEPGASEARRDAIRILETAPAHAVVLAHGDNETYPVWYMQEVEGLRRDVTIVVVPLIPAEWYRAEIVRRNGLLTPDWAEKWMGAPQVVAAICRGAAAHGRPVVSADSRTGDKFTPSCEIE
jgi:Protein of unknown function (DUF2723)